MDEQKIRASADSKNHDFVNMAVHEIKTPVAVLKGYLQLISRQLTRDNQSGYLKTVEKMDVQLDKLLHLISDLQDGYRRDDDIYCLMNEFDINDSIKSCCDNARATHPQLDIISETDSEVPVIKGDKDRIEQVIHNLITNGVKYGGKQIHLNIVSRVIENNIVVSVADKGPGVPETLQTQIFQRFYRIKSDTTQQTSGLGLGLYISAQIIHKHGGNIGVRNAEGGGAKFWFTLPL